MVLVVFFSLDKTSVVDSLSDISLICERFQLLFACMMGIGRCPTCNDVSVDVDILQCPHWRMYAKWASGNLERTSFIDAMKKFIIYANEDINQVCFANFWMRFLGPVGNQI